MARSAIVIEGAELYERGDFRINPAYRSRLFSADVRILAEFLPKLLIARVMSTSVKMLRQVGVGLFQILICMKPVDNAVRKIGCIEFRRTETNMNAVATKVRLKAGVIGFVIYYYR
jgi:hypothetical protein